MARKVRQMMRGNEYGGVGRLNSFPMVYVRRDGEVVEGTLSARMLYDSKGNEMAWVGSFVDLRERLEIERLAPYPGTAAAIREIGGHGALNLASCP